MTIRYGCFFSYAHGQHAYMSKFKNDLAEALKCYLEPHFDSEKELFVDSEQLGGGDDIDQRIARDVQEQVLAARMRLLGAEHGDTLRAKMALAGILAQLDELDTARSLAERVVRARLRQQGPEHADTRQARARLADIQRRLGEPAMAALYQEAGVPEEGGADPLQALGDLESTLLGAREPAGERYRQDALLALEGWLAAPRGTPR
ncbi:tetratricopeptide repeat protein [Rugamonas apoptosis]|uniref:Tetratricopeptide repeat protein n=1 Tax=Rugamonas apoptosis TaxID=2758570 RepID=A0A7W2FC58_9BURK|nr:tetratricopeptide repeat protein [Rugamonas apoptosis]MBA5689001.1 tetratricopeptide repeat protein [Rugamonas apoptosis]